METVNKINELNNNFKECKKKNELKEGEFYEIYKIKRTKNNYNIHGSILVESRDFITFFPNKYSEIINDSEIENWNNEIGKRYDLFFKVFQRFFKAGFSKKYNVIIPYKNIIPYYEVEIYYSPISEYLNNLRKTEELNVFNI